MSDVKEQIERNKRLLAAKVAMNGPPPAPRPVDADSIRGKHVDDSEISDGKILVYSEAKDQIVYKHMRRGGGGGSSISGTKGSDTCPYDADNNDIIDNSERLEGKTLAEVQDGLIPSNPPGGKKK